MSHSRNWRKVAVLLAGFAVIARTEALQARHLAESTRARYMAEGAISRAIWELRNPDPLTRWASDGRGYDFEFEGAKINVAVQDESDQAMSIYRTIVRLFPGCAQAHLYMGMEYLRTNNLKTATLSLLKDKTNEQISSDDFHQSFTRVEWNPKYLISEKQTLLAGAGWVKEQVKTIRYGSADPQHQYTSYAFAQYTFKPMDLKEVNLGLRYDQNNVYGGQLSPKISFTTPIRKNITWNGSLGLGFKAPDFRQLYLDFNNAAGGGYSVLGREVLTSKLAFLQQQGQIAGYLKDISNEGPIKPERSLSVNTGVHINASPAFSA